MKKTLLSLIYSATISALVLFNHTACSEDKGPAEENFGQTIFEVEPIIFEGIAGEQTAEIQFVAGAPWTATFTSSNNWVDASPTQGKAGDAVITVTPYSDNKSSTLRKAQLMVLVDGSEEPYMVEITQKSAAQSDLEITGDVNEGIMTLNADATGSQFTGVLEITSSNKWDIVTNENWLTFSKDKEPQDGKETTVRLSVTGDYNKFTAPQMNGEFMLQVPGTTPITIQVVAAAEFNIFDSETALGDERLNYEMVDTLKAGTYQTLFYVTSNIAWEIKNLPPWLEFANGKETATNRKEDGTLLTRNVGVGILVKNDALSAEARSTDIILSNQKGETLKQIHVEFKGISNNYLQHDFAFPSSDPLGGDFSFEAKASYIDPEKEEDYWKKIELPFQIKTSLDYSSIDNAPYHLIMCNAHNGIISKEEVHWATLRMGDETKNSSSNGLYTKETYLRANDRGDADDQNGLTNPATLREAFIFIVPKNIGFNDLFVEGTTLLKEEYAESFSHILQKQDHGINYVLKVNGLENGSTLYVPAEGGTFEFDVLDVTTDQLTPQLVRLWYNSSTGEWEERAATTAQENSITVGFIRSQTTGELETMVVSVADKMVTATRGFRFKINAFRGDGYNDTNVLTFDIMLK